MVTIGDTHTSSFDANETFHGSESFIQFYSLEFEWCPGRSDDKGVRDHLECVRESESESG
jgi:hypothetical protein